MEIEPEIELESLRLKETIPVKQQQPQQRSAPPRHGQGELFLKGPIPMNWLSHAARLPGKTFAVGVAIWYLAGRFRSDEVAVTGKTLDLFNIGRKAFYRALIALEEAGLIRVVRKTGACPVVTVLAASTAK